MSKAPIPDIILDNIYLLTPEHLLRRGIKLLLMDLDNTLAPYSDSSPSPALRSWTDNLKKAGISLFILSNNHGDRPRSFASALSLDYVGHAKKPSIKALSEVLKKKGFSKEETAIIGDQIYTDVLCGKRAGILTIAVRPISLRNPVHALRFSLEYPFRRAGIKSSKQNN